jgi:hypothetical protein
MHEVQEIGCAKRGIEGQVKNGINMKFYLKYFLVFRPLKIDQDI